MKADEMAGRGSRMTMEVAIAELALGGGRVGLCPIPGGGGSYGADLAAILVWRPAMVVTLATAREMADAGAEGLSADFAGEGVAWRHLPVPDFAAESAALMRHWRSVEDAALAVLAAGGGVLFHCRGGCGRSGMAVMRLMVAAGEAPAAALARLRGVRHCAVETEPQRRWAALGACVPPGAAFRLRIPRQEGRFAQSPNPGRAPFRRSDNTARDPMGWRARIQFPA